MGNDKLAETSLQTLHKKKLFSLKDASFSIPKNDQQQDNEAKDRIWLQCVVQDCLLLNIFVPTGSAAEEEGATGLPVMVWLHGGAFLFGQG